MPGSEKDVKKIAIHLSMTLQTGLDYLLDLSVVDLAELAKEVHDQWQTARNMNSH